MCFKNVVVLLILENVGKTLKIIENPNGTGAPLGQCLWKLPHRRFHPDYYEKIKRPISMSQIQQKLKKRDYTHSNQFVFDLFLMIDNSKSAYPPSHRSHKVINN